MESLIVAFGWLLWIAVAGLVVLGLIFMYLWFFKQCWSIVADVIGDKVIEVVQEIRDEQKYIEQ